MARVRSVSPSAAASGLSNMASNGAAYCWAMRSPTVVMAVMTVGQVSPPRPGPAPPPPVDPTTSPPPAAPVTAVSGRWTDSLAKALNLADGLGPHGGLHTSTTVMAVIVAVAAVLIGLWARGRDARQPGPVRKLASIRRH